MYLRKFYVKRIALIVSMLLLTWFGFNSRMNYMQTGRCARAQADSIFRGKTLMKTIPCSDEATDLIGFELHTKYVKHAGVTRTEYNVVMRNLDPRVDTYKTYCRDIIADLAGGVGENELVTINVFDSFEAYCFYADDNSIKTDEDALLEHHLVATYERGRGEDEEDPHCLITFYPYSGSYLRETMGCM